MHIGPVKPGELRSEPLESKRDPELPGRIRGDDGLGWSLPNLGEKKHFGSQSTKHMKLQGGTAEDF